MSPFCKVERLGKHIKLKYFQKVSFCGAQISKLLQIFPKFVIFEGFFLKFRDLGTTKPNFLKIFSFICLPSLSTLQNGLIHILNMISCLIMKQNVRTGIVE